MSDNKYLNDDLEEDDDQVEEESNHSEEEENQEEAEEDENLDEYDDEEDQGEEAQDEDENLEYETFGNGIILKIPNEEQVMAELTDDVPETAPPVRVGAGAFKPIPGKGADKIKRIKAPLSIDSYLIRSPEEDNEMYQMRVDFTKKINALGGYPAEKCAYLGSMIAKKKRLKVKFAPTDEQEVRNVMDRLRGT